MYLQQMKKNQIQTYVDMAETAVKASFSNCPVMEWPSAEEGVHQDGGGGKKSGSREGEE